MTTSETAARLGHILDGHSTVIEGTVQRMTRLEERVTALEDNVPGQDDSCVCGDHDSATECMSEITRDQVEYLEAHVKELIADRNLLLWLHAEACYWRDFWQKEAVRGVKKTESESDTPESIFKPGDGVWHDDLKALGKVLEVGKSVTGVLFRRGRDEPFVCHIDHLRRVYTTDSSEPPADVTVLVDPYHADSGRSHQFLVRHEGGWLSADSPTEDLSCWGRGGSWSTTKGYLPRLGVVEYRDGDEVP